MAQRLGLALLLFVCSHCGADDAVVQTSCTEPAAACTAPPCEVEQGRMAGMTAAHNAVRATVTAATTPLPALRWSGELSASAQSWADALSSNGCQLVHSGYCGVGENLAYFRGQQPTGTEVVMDGWASELACYTYGRFKRDDQCTADCDRFGGCGHYTQLIWAATQQLGCGRADCPDGGEVWVCQYDPPGNVIGVAPYSMN